MIELSVNGEVLSRKPPADTAGALTTFKVQWDPLAAGQYVLVARSQNHAGVWSSQTSSVVTLTGPQALVEVEQPPMVITPSATAADLATPTPTPACVDRAGFVADVRTPTTPTSPLGGASSRSGGCGTTAPARGTKATRSCSSMGRP